MIHVIVFAWKGFVFILKFYTKYTNPARGIFYFCVAPPLQPMMRLILAGVKGMAERKARYLKSH